MKTKRKMQKILSFCAIICLIFLTACKKDTDDKESKNDNTITKSYKIVSENEMTEEQIDRIVRICQTRANNYCTEAQIEFNSKNEVISVTMPDYIEPEVFGYITNNGTLEFLLKDDEKKEVFLDGSYVETAVAIIDDSSGRKDNTVRIKLNEEGAVIFEQITTDNVGKNIVILYDGEDILDATIQCAILGGNVVVNNINSFEEAQSIAWNITEGSLGCLLEPVE